MSNKGLLLSALSGGADSTALLLWLLEKGYNVEAVHCNFHLRGEESDRDERFCQELCSKHNVKLHIAHFDTVAYAELHHQSIETAARNLRYHYFFDLVRDLDAQAICVAHNRNDQAETLLMNLVRGAGIHGLTGMKRERKVNWKGTEIKILRPLLDVSRAQIVEFLKQRNQDWVTDSTNLETDATRNKFRLEVIPLLEKINPSAIANIAGTCSRLQSVENIYNHVIDEGKNSIVRGEKEKHISIDNLLNNVAAESILFETMNDFGFNGKQVEDVFAHLKGNSGRTWTSATHKLLIDRDEIIIVPIEEEAEISIKIPEEGTYIINTEEKIRIKEEAWNEDSVISKEPNCVCLDAGKVSFPLTIRTVKRGDRFVPFGMKGSKLVSDFLTDLKLSVIDKQKQLVACDKDGEIIWIIGRRPDNRYRITSKTTRGLRIEYLKQK